MVSLIFGLSLAGLGISLFCVVGKATPTDRFFRTPGATAGAAWLVLLMGPALLDAIPVGATTLLEELLRNLFTAGVVETGRSLPLAVLDTTGTALRATADTVPVGHTPMLYAIRTTLVALIVGGVSVAAAWLFAAAVSAKHRGKGLVDGMDHLSNRDGTFPWRGAMLVVSAAWLFLSWILLLWPDWHVFGTDTAGHDVLGLLMKGLLPGWGISSILGLSGFFFFRRQAMRTRWVSGAAMFAPVGTAFGAVSVVTESGATLFGLTPLLLAGDTTALLFALGFWGLIAWAALRVARAVR